MLRPSFASLARSLQTSLALGSSAASKGVTAYTAPVRMNSTFSPLRHAFQQQKAQASQSLLRLHSGVRLSSPNSVGQQIRGVRTSPFRPQGGAGDKIKAFSLPHQAPSGPRSMGEPGAWARLLSSGGLIVGGAVAVHWLMNRETRDAPFSEFVSNYVHSTFGWLATGLAMTGGGAFLLHRMGASRSLMAANPWLVMGAGLVCSIGGMIGAQTLPPGSPGKMASYVLFNAAQAAVLSPLFFFAPAVLSRAALYTAGIVGSCCWVGMTAKDGQYLWLGTPLLIGVSIVALSSIAPLVLPATAFRALAVTEALSIYGGLGVFSLFLIYDSQSIVRKAQMAQAGMIPADPLRDSIGLELDAINIFVRLVTILGGQQRKR
ncbi:hypothetical protein IE81DRAFT_324282 [Ceraceosorus guamensis]|uniref:Bax inhibitor family protein n=1 Tax=Ceraceosorus guamensis TaxID=1522189 RepID=A0A316VVI8_9BASI|nr:hypothetical protein IE81DRAFT_324282 [Ceraceosorus guamensis]PWN41657.1 hypothetical protein IE81DRAFT_324282 [Ceraceosorus guamensis]